MLARHGILLDSRARCAHNQGQAPDSHGGHAMDEVAVQSVSKPVDDICADAYAAFWQCIDADEPMESNFPIDGECNAYEQFWNWLDTDGSIERAQIH